MNTLIINEFCKEIEKKRATEQRLSSFTSEEARLNLTEHVSVMRLMSGETQLGIWVARENQLSRSQFESNGVAERQRLAGRREDGIWHRHATWRRLLGHAARQFSAFDRRGDATEHRRIVIDNHWASAPRALAPRAFPRHCVFRYPTFCNMFYKEYWYYGLSGTTDSVGGTEERLENVTSPVPATHDVSIFRFGSSAEGSSADDPKQKTDTSHVVHHGLGNFWALAPDHHGQEQVASPRPAATICRE
ncbi:hypothetical protein B0H14DRAFT_2637341 [Mycena olivaceomarginata]|nr:hypothetical protein B0H14DRAFT_2637341 [Mycena olivaceomarginata]